MSLFNTPAISVRNKTRSAFNSPAIRPAATSALTLYAMSFSSPIPVPIGLTTGHIPISNNSLSNFVLTLTTFPTYCKSNPSLFSSLTHCNSESSRPDSPIARPPLEQILLLISLLTLPHKTISATSTTSLELTRNPPSNRLSTPTLSNIALICGPPPCTTTIRIPNCCSAATSSQNLSFNSVDVMALPPYLTTTVLPRNVEAAAATFKASNANIFSVVIASAAATCKRRSMFCLL